MKTKLLIALFSIICSNIDLSVIVNKVDIESYNENKINENINRY